MENNTESQKEGEQPFVRIPRAQKRILKYEKVKQKVTHQRKKMNEIKKQRWHALSTEQKQEIKQKRQKGDENLKLGYENGLEVYIDMDYDVLMSDREIRSLSLQVAHTIGANKELPQPIKLHLTNFTGKQKVELEKQGCHSWMIHLHEESIEEIVRNNKTAKEFIYLSPDAEDELDSIDLEKQIFVVGGFVDKVVQKYMSVNKASALQLHSVRLPINQFMKGKVRPLNIDTVICILSEYYDSKDWKTAYERATSRAEGIVTKYFKQSGQQQNQQEVEQ